MGVCVEPCKLHALEGSSDRVLHQLFGSPPAPALPPRILPGYFRAQALPFRAAKCPTTWTGEFLGTCALLCHVHFGVAPNQRQSLEGSITYQGALPAAAGD